MKLRVCGTVILYNPEMDILDNIQSYLDQVELLVVVDNSVIANNELVNKLKSINKIKYISYNENLGVAKALNIAAQSAIDDGFQYLLTMDQDSRAPANMVSSLLEVAQSNVYVGIVTPLHANKFGTHLKNTSIANVEKVVLAMTSGNLLSLEAYDRLGKFCEDFFIDYVDIEYCFRMYCNKYNIYRLNHVILDHDEADLSEIKLFSKKIHPHNHKPFRLYYKTRNLLYLRKKYKNIVPHLMKKEYDSYFRTIARLIIFEKYKSLKLKMVFLGIWDYLIGKKGKGFDSIELNKKN